MTQQPAAVIIPTDRPAALGIARSLGRRGIPVYGIDSDPQAIGMFSRYLTACPLPNSDDSEENRLQYLIDLGKKLGEKAVLYPLRDDDVILCSRERDELQKYYLYVMPDHATITNLLTKDGLHQVARACDIPDPQMFLACNYDEIEGLADGLDYPVILKPVLSTSWLRPEIISLLRDDPLSGPPKVALCRNAEELLQTYRKISVYDSQIIVQEVIPGEDERLTYFCFYLNRQSIPLAFFAGRKLRVLPVGFGSASYVRSFRDPELEEISFKLLSGASYQGLGGIEFKKDPRDERYKLIEFNARFGMWDALSTRCGIDIPYIAYCDALGWPAKAQHDYRENVIWVDLQRDIRAFVIYRRRKQLSFGDWLRSLRGEKDWAVYSRDDWKPALVATTKLLERPWSRVKRVFRFVNQ
jgi:D-aspartate ligase